MNNIKKAIICLIILIILIITILAVLLSKFKKGSIDNNNNIVNIDEDSEKFENDESYQEPLDERGYAKVTDENIFYSTVECLEKFIEILKYNINENTENEYLKNIKSEKDKKDAIYDLLDKEYTERSNIDEDIQDFILVKKVLPVEMKIKYEEKMHKCIVRTIILNEKRKEKYFIIRRDMENETFSIEIVNTNGKSIENIKINENNKSIEKNEYNKYEINLLNLGEIVKKYLENYRFLAINYPDIAYEYLEEKYKNKRFGSFEKYKEYLDKNKNKIEKIEAQKYMPQSLSESKYEYICVDQYENMYIIITEAAMEYTIMLDTHTIDMPEFLKKYNESSSEKKVGMNIEKIKLALNSQDYSYVYGKLDETFRNKNFESIESFENYCKNNFFEKNFIEYTSFNNEGNNIYSVKIKVKPEENSAIVKETVIVMQLREETDFVMSFKI